MTQDNLDLRLTSGASVWDAWTYGCMKNCPQSADCPCLPYRLGDVPPRYPVPATVKVDPLIEAYILRDIIAWLRR